MTATRSTAWVSGLSGGRCFQLSGRVETGGDRLLQLLHRWRGLRGGLAQLGRLVRHIGRPLRIAAKVQHAAIGELQGDGTRFASEDLLAGIDPVAFDQKPPYTFCRNGNNLTYDGFDDGDDTAHWTFSGWILCRPVGLARPRARMNRRELQCR
ncbi:hypothetical protein [Pseudomonas phoenicis]|uniref:hypothetical protein n=1 Tax=unclassified Pseudomonas TaxID=196821 RepID=UPI0039A4E25A